MTFKCRVCDGHYTPTVPRLYPDAPGNYCDKCALMDELTRPPNPPSQLERKIADLKIGASFFLPVTPEDPCPWDTAKAEIRRAGWAFLSGALCVHRVQKGDAFFTTRDGDYDFETGDGARVFKTPTREDLRLGMEFVRKLTA